MATKEKEVAKNQTNGATKVETKANANVDEKVKSGTKKIVKRQISELKSSERGRIIFVLNNAKTLAGKKDNEGLEFLGEHKETSYIASRLYSVTKANGKIETIDAKSPEYVKLLGLAKDSHTEMKTSVYGPKTKELLTFVLKEVCGGAKGFNPSSLMDMEW